MAAFVQLPSNALIDHWGFCRAIARAIRPSGEDGVEGIDCIAGKQIKVENRTAISQTKEQWAVETQGQLVLTSHDGKTLRQLRQDSSTSNEQVTLGLVPEDSPKIVVEEFSFSYELEEQDRVDLEKLLPCLPPLRYPMPDEDAAAFMKAYFNLPTHPEWEPTLITPADLDRWKVAQDKIFDFHRKKLQDDLSKGILIAVDKQNVPVKYLSAGICIPREYAIEYLKRCGIPHAGVDAQDHFGNEQLAAGLTDAAKHISAESISNQHPAPTSTAISPAQVGGADQVVNDASAGITSSIHLISAGSDPISDLILEAQNRAGERRNEYHYLYADMVLLAKSGKFMPQITGFKDRKGITYLSGQTEKHFTEGALRKRLDPKQRGVKKTRSKDAKKTTDGS